MSRCECCDRHWLLVCENCGHDIGPRRIDPDRLAGIIRKYKQPDPWDEEGDIVMFGGTADDFARVIAKAYEEER